MVLAYSYIRFSTPDQLKGDSLRRQLEKSEQYAKENGLILDTSLKMRDLGLSAFDRSNVTKGALGGFLKAVEAGRVAKGSYLLVEHLDRLSRAEVMDALQQFMTIMSAGIVIVTLGDGQVYSRDTVAANPMLLMYSITLMSSSHDESAKKAERIGAAWNRKIDAAIEDGKVLSNRVPLWMTSKDRKIELIPERADVIRRVFELSKQGVGQQLIAKTLNGDTPPWGRTTQWQQSYIMRLMRSVSVYGAIKLKNQIVENYYPAVITRDEFLYNQSLLKCRRNTDNGGNKKGSRLSNLFSGLLRCGYCGSSMVMNSSTPIGRNAPRIEEKYIVCNGAKTGKVSTCKCVNWQYVDIEQNFLFRSADLNLQTLFGVNEKAKVDHYEKKKMALMAEIDDRKAKIEFLFQSIEGGVHVGVMKRITDHESHVTTLSKELEEVERDLSIKRHTSNSGKSRMALLLKMFKQLKDADDDVSVKIVRESIQSQIKDFVEKIELFPTGPVLNKAQKDMRFMRVHFKSGAPAVEWD